MAGSEGHLPERIARFHGRLNREGVVPGLAYRRNHVGYALVCCVNNVTGCLLGKSYGTAALFVARAVEELARLRGLETARRPEWVAWLALVEEYLRAVVEFVPEGCIAGEVAERIPREWRTRGRA